LEGSIDDDVLGETEVEEMIEFSIRVGSLDVDVVVGDVEEVEVAVIIVAAVVIVEPIKVVVA
jgi:hypothetical protein